MGVDYSRIYMRGISYKSMGVHDAWLLLYIPNPGLYNKIYIQSVCNTLRKLTSGLIVIINLFR